MSNNRRVQHNESILKELQNSNETLNGLIEGNRKRIVNACRDIDALKKGGPIQITSAPATEEKAESAVEESDGNADAIEKLRRQIQRVEGSLIRRIASIEGSLSRVDSIEIEMGVMKNNIAKALEPRDPEVTREDFDRW